MAAIMAGTILADSQDLGDNLTHTYIIKCIEFVISQRYKGYSFTSYLFFDSWNSFILIREKRFPLIKMFTYITISVLKYINIL